MGKSNEKAARWDNRLLLDRVRSYVRRRMGGWSVMWVIGPVVHKKTGRTMLPGRFRLNSAVDLLLQDFHCLILSGGPHPQQV